MVQQTEEKRIRLVVLSDHGLFRESLSRFLASQPHFEIAGECGTSAEALKVLNGSTADIVLLDFDLGSQRGTAFISAALQAGYGGRFLLVAGTADASSAATALKLGATGIFLKTDGPDRLVRAIRLVANGEVWVDPKIIQMLAEQLIDRCPQFDDEGSSGVLQDRERSVLLGILGGLTNRKIGGNMGLSEGSVKNIVQRLFRKAGVKKRSQLVRVALEGSLGMTRRSISRQWTKASLPARLSPARQSHG